MKKFNVRFLGIYFNGLIKNKLSFIDNMTEQQDGEFIEGLKKEDWIRYTYKTWEK